MLRNPWNHRVAILLSMACFLCVQSSLAVEFANIDIVDDAIDPINNAPTVTIPGGQGTAGFNIEAGAITGLFPVRFGPSATDDAASGVLLGYVRESGRNQLDSLGGTETLYATSASSRRGDGSFSLVGRRAGDDTLNANTLYAPGAAFNANLASAYFPFSEGWVGGTAYNADNGLALNELVGSAGLTLGVGQNFEQDVFGVGDHLVTLPGVTDTRRQGLLLVGGGKNEGNYALSEPTADGTGFNVTGHDNAGNGSEGEVDPVSFVFMPLGTPNVTMARVFARGHGANQNPVTMIESGNAISISRDNPGEYRLSIAGHTPSSGTLLVSPSGSNDGAGGLNVDNIVTYRADGNDWVILSQDGPALSGAGQESGSRAESYFSFAFLPFATPATAPGPVPVVTSLKNRVIGWNAQVTEVTPNNSSGDMFIDEPEQTADVNVVSLFENRGDNVFAVDGAFMARTEGVLFATISEGLRDNDTPNGGLKDYGVIAVSQSNDDEWWVHTSAADAGINGEHNINFSATFFGADAGFNIGQHVATPAGALEVLIAGEDANSDGALFVTVNAANQGNFTTATPKVDGTGWDIAHFDNDLTAAVESVNHIYLPFDAENLVAGRVDADGTIAASTDTNDFSLTKSADGSYLLTVNGKSPSDGMLLLTSTGEGASSDNSVVYETAGSNFRILGLDMITDAESIGGAFVDLEDTAFNFAYIDFDNPVALASVGLVGDFNNNGIVDAADYTVWLDNLGSASALLNDNNLGTPVGQTHYDLWKANFGNTLGNSTGGGSAVPEPSTIILLGLALLGNGLKRRVAEIAEKS